MSPPPGASTSSTPDGEVIAEVGQQLNDTVIKKLRKAEINKVQRVRRVGPRRVARSSRTRSAKDPTHEREGSAAADLRAAPSGRRADAQTAKQALERLFFSPKRYDLGRVGRYKINQRLGTRPRRPTTRC